VGAPSAIEFPRGADDLWATLIFVVVFIGLALIARKFGRSQAAAVLFVLAGLALAGHLFAIWDRGQLDLEDGLLWGGAAALAFAASWHVVTLSVPALVLELLAIVATASGYAWINNTSIAVAAVVGLISAGALVGAHLGGRRAARVDAMAEA